jgi:Ca2+/Na+ antiporter
MFGLNGDALMGISFSVLILLIGVVGTFQSVKNTKGPRERAFAAQSNLLAWMAVAILFVTMYFVPEPYNYLVVVLYFAAFPFIVYRVCSRRLLIRRLEKMHATANVKT